MTYSVVWLKRDLRVADHAKASIKSDKLQIALDF
jgi:deoxyribodipyrimidine photolyase